MNNFWIKLKKVLEKNFVDLPFEFERDAEGNRKNPNSKVVSFIDIVAFRSRGYYTRDLPTSWGIALVIIAIIAIATILISSKFGFI